MRLPSPDRRRALRLLERVLRTPTSPFHEHRVRGVLTRSLEERGIRCRLDRYGNLTARYRRGRAKPLALLAHMDHPGFEIVSARGRTAAALWNGQVPPFPLKGTRLALWTYEGKRRGTAVVLRGDGRLPRPKAKHLELRVPAGTRSGDFGNASLPPFALRGGRIVSKALDNTAGCGSILAALDHLSHSRLPGDVTALFTRAEEGGLHGSFGAIRSGTLRKRMPVVVLECSKEMPGAEMGKGPVIRVGDKARVFDPDLILAMEAAAKALKKVPFQRRLMDGGTCECTLFGMAGYATAGLAFPLGNYHNIGARGIRAEYISQDDFMGGVALLAAFAAFGLDVAKARKALQERFAGVFDARKLLRSR